MPTVPFHLSSSTATTQGSSHYSLQLSPELDIPHTAHATVYLHNLMFTNSFANVDRVLYGNSTCSITYDPGGGGDIIVISVDLPTGAYSLQDVEDALNLAVYQAGTGVGTLYKAIGTYVTSGTYVPAYAGAVQPQGTCEPNQRSKLDGIERVPGAYQNALTAAQMGQLVSETPSGYGSDRFWIKPIVLEADVGNNTVIANAAVELTVNGPLFSDLLDFDAGDK